MRARHVWLVFAFVLGAAIFAESLSEDGIMWGVYSVMLALKAGAIVTAGVLGILALIMSMGSD